MDQSSGQRVNSTLVEIAFLGTIAFLAHQHVLGETSVMAMLSIYATSRFGVGLVKRFVASEAAANYIPPSTPGPPGSGQSGGHRVTRGVIIESIPVSEDRFPPPVPPATGTVPRPEHPGIPRPGPKRDPRRDERGSFMARFPALARWILTTPYAYLALTVIAGIVAIGAWSILGGIVSSVAHR